MSARADDNVATSGIAMLGAPALDDTATHLPFADPDAPKGGHLRQSASGSFDTLNPFTIKGKSAQGMNYVHDRLMGRSWDEAFTLYPLIAEKAEMPDDRSSITFHLDPRARFSDGSPITADDVLFSFETLKEKGRPNMRQIYKLVDHIERKDDQSLTFVLTPQANRETPLIIAMMPVLSRKYWTGRNFETTGFDIPVSSGPYKVAKVDPGRRTVLARNPDYWAKDIFVNKGLYNFDTITTDYFRDDTVALEAFRKGDLDIRVEQDIGKWNSAYRGAPDVRLEEIAHGRVEKMWGFIFNLRRAPFDDLRVRRALSLLVDYEWINRNLFHGLYRATDSFFPNSDLAAKGLPSEAETGLLAPYRDQLPVEVFGNAWVPAAATDARTLRDNRKHADALLKDAGWIVKDGRRVHRDTGRAFRFEILVGTKDDEKIALSFRRSLAALGIDAQLRSLDSAAFSDRMMGYEYDMTLYFWQNSLSPGTEQMLYWGCRSAQQKGSFNYSGLCLNAVDDLAHRLPNVTDRNDLTANIRALDRILTHQHIAIPLFYSGRDLIASQPRIGHPRRAALYGNMMESWYATPPEARNKSD